MRAQPIPSTDLASAPWRPWQRALLWGVPLGLGAQAYLSPAAFLTTWNLATLTLFALIVGFKVLAVFLGQFRRFVVSPTWAELQAQADGDLPSYTVLVPLYRETEVLRSLVEALGRLDYPAEKLEILLLLEECDTEMRRAVAALGLGEPFRVVVVPDGRPRTKPRACNHGLGLARGELLVIYDAEDRPEADQLRKAAAAFRALPDRVMCLQAKLNLYNSRQNLLARLFTLEYSAWFDLYLPGLHALRSPIPLGGTSNHLRTEPLRAAGGWDPYNVTEDCDLGMRLSRRGGEIRILDSTTWEEAPVRLLPWLRQRSRWIKGYWQTLLVHTRSPLAALREFGPWRFFQMLLTVGGPVVTLLLMPVCWAIVAAWLLRRWPLFAPERPWTALFPVAAGLLVLFNGYFVLVHLVAAVRRRNYGLIPATFLLPLYWFLMGFGAWFGFLQYFWAPFLWHKTPHGLADGKSDRAWGLEAPPYGDAARPAMRRFAAIATSAVFAAGLVAVTIFASRLPRAMHISQQVYHAGIRLNRDFVSGEAKVDASWFGRTRCRLTVDAPRAADLRAGDVRVVVYAKVNDGEWFQTEVQEFDVAGKGIRLAVPLTTGWDPAPGNESAVWGPWSLRRVVAVGVRFYGRTEALKGLRLASASAEGESAQPALAVADLTAPAETPQRDLFEARFRLEREYDNPFDPRQIAVDGEFTAPSGKVLRIPAFYTQDYERCTTGRSESFTPVGAPYWAIRFSPGEAGEHRWRLVVKDASGGAIATAPRVLAVASSANRGSVRVSEDPHYFAYDNGEFFYPIFFNVAWPHDSRTAWISNFRLAADPTPDTLLFAKYFDKMAAANVSVARVWMTPWWCGLEWNRAWPGYHGMGRYNMQQAWRMDYLLQQARRRGLMLEVVVNNHGTFTQVYDSQWDSNPYNARNGGMLRDCGELLTNPQAIEMTKQRMRYIVARYGAYPNLFAYHLFTEIDVVSRNLQERVAWLDMMSRYIHEADQNRHIVTTEYTNTGDPQAWQIPTIDYSQSPGYTFGNQPFLPCLDRYLQMSPCKNKPFVIEEYGGAWDGLPANLLAMELHTGIWAGWNLPMASTPMPWWWNFIFDRDLQCFWAVFAEYVRGEDLRGVAWRYGTSGVDGAPGLRAATRLSPERGYGWVYHEQTVNSLQEPARMFGVTQPVGDLFPAVEGATLVLDGLRDGRYAVEYWDTWTKGQVTRIEATAQDSRLRLPLPHLTRDVAFKVRRQAD